MIPRFPCLPLRTALAAGARGPRQPPFGTPSRHIPASGSLVSFLVRALCSIGVAFLLPDPGAAQAPFLVKDNTSADPTHLENVNDVLFFTVGSGLWRTDATTAGTILVADFVFEGTNMSLPSDLTKVGSTVFFTTSDHNGPYLWKSDGTAAGTGCIASDPWALDLTDVNGTLFFGSGGELWKSDGTGAGTMLVKEFYPSYVGTLTNVNGTLFFTAGGELWKSDGTEAGTVRVKALGAFSNPRSLTNVNGKLFFAADDGTHGDELWKSDGSEAGTVLVRDIFPSAGHGSPSSLVNVNGTLFFQANDGATGQGLWKSDGTEAGTVLVKAIGPVTPESLTNVNGTLFFAVDDGTLGNELWKSDGTEAGTVLVKDIQPGSSGSGPAALTNANGTLVFSADDGSAGREPWRSDGTAAGTMRIADLHVGAGGSNPAEFTVSGPYVFFVGNDGPASAELWAMGSPTPLAVSGRRPDAITLLGNRPNPFSRATEIGFDLPRPARIALRLYDVTGRLVRTLTDGSWPAGRHSIEWNGATEDGRVAPAGVYLLRMESEGVRSYGRAVVLR